MKYLRFLFLSLGTSLLLTACLKAPEFGDPPRLTGIEVYVKEQQAQQQDSLVIRVDFEDGDGDLGVTGGETQFGAFVPVPNPDDGGFWYFDENDERLPSYNCRQYVDTDLNPTDGIDDMDTIRADYDEAYYNFSITLYTKVNGQYEEYDFLLQPACSPPLGGRFPPLRDDFSVDRPLKGVIQWGTLGFYNLSFGGDTLRIDVTIRDRAGNVSNVITKEDFTLSDPDIVRSEQDS
ncbi:MAG: hypothetical protein WA958_01385 [Tunicatimonas sp.]